MGLDVPLLSRLANNDRPSRVNVQQWSQFTLVGVSDAWIKAGARTIVYAALGATWHLNPRPVVLRVSREWDNDSPLQGSTEVQLEVLDMLATSLLVFLPRRNSTWESHAQSNAHLYLPLLAEISDQLSIWNAHVNTRPGLSPVKSFAVIPQPQLKARHVPIPSEVLQKLGQGLGHDVSLTEDVEALWSRYFDLAASIRGSKETKSFTHFITTDGVTASVHFEKTNDDAMSSKHDAGIARIRDGFPFTASDPGRNPFLMTTLDNAFALEQLRLHALSLHLMNPDDDSAAFADFMADRALQQLHTEAEAAAAAAAAAAPPPPRRRRRRRRRRYRRDHDGGAPPFIPQVVPQPPRGGDRRVWKARCRIQAKRFTTLKWTAAKWYDESGTTHATLKTRIWERHSPLFQDPDQAAESLGPVAQLFQRSLLTRSPKTGNSTTYQRHSNCLLQFLDSMMTFKLHRKHRDLGMWSYGQRQRAYDRIARDLSGEEGETVVVMGAGTFHSNGRGGVSVPTRSLVREIRHRVKYFVLQDEWGSSKNCSDCHERLQDSGVIGNPHYPSYHVRYCRACNRLWERNINACNNIAFLVLCRAYNLPKPAVFRRGRRLQQAT